MTKRKTPTAIKAPAERTDAQGDHSEQSVTKLAEVNDPADLTEAKIDEISGDDGTDSAENGANQEVADHLRATKADAKSKFGDPDINLSGGRGGGAGEPG